jgi:hypothetical protein
MGLTAFDLVGSHAMPAAAVTEEPLFCFYKNHATWDRG